jgi:transposase InsO family protein
MAATSDAEHRGRFHTGVRRHRSRSLAARFACDAHPRSSARAVGLPQTIVVDNGPEFAGRTLDAWAYARGVTLRFIRPGKPIENAYVESFNGKFRDECLNEHWFVSLLMRRPRSKPGASITTRVRPHSSLAGRTPNQFAASLRGSPAAAGSP